MADLDVIQEDEGIVIDDDDNDNNHHQEEETSTKDCCEDDLDEPVILQLFLLERKIDFQTQLLQTLLGFCLGSVGGGPDFLADGEDDDFISSSRNHVEGDEKTKDVAFSSPSNNNINNGDPGDANGGTTGLDGFVDR